MIALPFILVFIFGSSITMASPYQFTQEQQLPQAFKGQIQQHWQTGIFASFSSFDALEIHYALFISLPNRPCIVISPGRGESYVKYQEVVFDLHQQGYNVAIIDHRGQGLSQRLLLDKHKGYVADFNDYVLDLQQFVSTIVKPRCSAELLLLAHSMGATIAIRYIQQFADTFTAVVLSSPMIAINSGAVPRWLAKPLIMVCEWLNSLFSQQSAYFFGHGPYKNKPFAGNDLMQSELRFKIFKRLYQQQPELQLGGVTFTWLKQAIRAEQQIFTELNKISCPVLVLQSEHESVVSNYQQDLFCQQLHNLQPQSCPHGQPLVLANARHELLFEIDSIRNQALSASLDWFKRYSN